MEITSPRNVHSIYHLDEVLYPAEDDKHLQSPACHYLSIVYDEYPDESCLLGLDAAHCELDESGTMTITCYTLVWRDPPHFHSYGLPVSLVWWILGMRYEPDWK